MASRRAQSRLLETRDLTFDKVVQVATALELSEKDAQQLQAGSTAVVNYMGTKPNKKLEKKGQSNRKSKTTTAGNNAGSLNTNKAQGKTLTNVSCYRCEGKHLAPKCTLNRNIKCNNCGTPGHLQKVCMGAREAPTNQMEEVLLIEHTEFRDKFYETLTVERRPLRFEVDSGAAVTIVSTGTLKVHFPNR